VVFTFAPILLGFHTFTATSDAMSPSIRSGALLLDRSIRAADAKAGDVVTFRDPNDSSRFITSRVVDVKKVAGVALFTTRGDASAISQEWSVPTSGRINRVSIHVARLGSLVAWLRTGAGLITLALTPLGLMLLVSLLRERDPAWESPREDSFWGELAGQRSS
jgi:signal peptidase